MLNDLKLSLQYILPKLWLTRLAGWGASKRAGWLTKLVIDLFVKYYKVDMKEAQKPDTAAYRTFNDFFVRPLRDDVRPLNTDPNVLNLHFCVVTGGALYENSMPLQPPDDHFFAFFV